MRAREAIERHAVEGYPLEICGFLVGSADGDTRRAVEAWPVRNAWEDDPGTRQELFDATSGESGVSAERWESAAEERRFLIASEDLLACMKRSRERKRDLVGVYHTHPNHPAVPSDFDRAAAWPEWSYVIVSVRDGQVAEFRSWILNEDGAAFVEEPVIPEPPGHPGGQGARG
jgi:proteasome lid subunit RPN8/RPN11